MRFLTPQHWQSFKEVRGDGKEYFDGVRFEKLVRQILISDFEGSWDSTAITWDGGKDFVDRSLPGEESWAECKMYEKSLSISKISNSLIMAINKKNVSQLLFFSYSSLNQNAIYHLSGFSEATSVKVQVFDNEKLEYLILKNDLILDTFFKSFTQDKDYLFEDKTKVSHFFTTDVHVEYSQLKDISGIHKKSKIQIPANTPCLYEIFIQNQVLGKKALLEISLVKFKKYAAPLGLLNAAKLEIKEDWVIRKFFQPGQVGSIKIYMAPAQIGVLKIPEINVKIDEFEEQLPALTLHVSSLNRPPLIGGDVIQKLHRFSEIISTSSVFSLSVVTGRTGVGKTRYLEEARIKLLENNYTVLYFDGHTDACKTFCSFIVNLLSQIWRLPSLIDFPDSDLSGDTNERDQKNMFDRVCSFLYLRRNGKNEVEDMEEIVELFQHGVFSQKMAILIDNVQSLDKQSLDFLAKIKTELTGKPAKNVIVYAFNEDELIYSEAAAVLHHEIKRTAANVDERLLNYTELPEFSRDTVEVFLNTICGNIDAEVLFTDHYPMITKLIIEHVLPRPLDLYQLFLAAQDAAEPIAILKNGLFHVIKVDDFHDLIRNINKRTEAIFEFRLHCLKDKPQHLRLLLSMFLMNRLDTQTSLSLTGAKEKDLAMMVDTGWFKYGEAGYLSFFHPAIGRFISKVLDVDTPSVSSAIFDEKHKRYLYDRLLKKTDHIRSSLSIFFLSAKKTLAELKSALAEIAALGRTTPSDRLTMYARTLYRHIINATIIPPQFYIGVAEAVCRFSSDGRLTDFVERLKTIRNKLDRFIPATDEETFQLFRITRQFAGYSNSAGKPDDSYAMLVNDLALIEKLPASVSPRAKLSVKVNLSNRQCVCLKDLGKRIEALSIGYNTYDLAKENDLPFFSCLSLIDISAVYKNTYADKDKFLEHIQRAIFAYAALPAEDDDTSLYLGCLENQAHMASVLKNYAEAIELSDDYIRIAREYNDNNYLLKGLCLKSIYMLQAYLNGEQNIQLAALKRLASQTEDLSVVMRSTRTYTKALHLQAIIAIANNDNILAKSFYEAALINLKNNLLLRCFYYISPAEICLLYDAANFWIDHKPGAYPISRHLLFTFNVPSVYAAIESGEPIPPVMMFNTGAYNLPLA